MNCSITLSGFDSPPDQKSFQMLSIWLRISPTIIIPPMPFRYNIALLIPPSRVARLDEFVEIVDDDRLFGGLVLALDVEPQPLLEVVEQRSADLGRGETVEHFVIERDGLALLRRNSGFGFKTTSKNACQ